MLPGFQIPDDDISDEVGGRGHAMKLLWVFKR
jgi:hypothetical protein